MGRIGSILIPCALVSVLVASALLVAGCPPPAKEAGGGSAGPATGTSDKAPQGSVAASIEEGEYGDPEGVLVGAYFGLTGPDAVFGQDSGKAIILALEEMEAANWDGGAPIRLLLYDDLCRPDNVGTILNKLIHDDKVVAVIGEVASKLSLQGGPICQEAKIPMVSPSSTNPRVTEIGDYIFRTCFIDPYQGYVMAAFALDHLGAKTAAVLYPQDNDYSVGLAEFFEQAFVEGGGQVVDEVAYGKDQQDFSPELDRIRQKSPDVLYAPCYYDDAGLIAKQARERDMTMPILGGDGWDSPTVYEVGGEATNNCFFSNHYSKDSEAPEVQSFVKAFTKRWGEAPSAMAATAYDAIRIVVAAIHSVPDPRDSGALRDAIAATKDFPGVTGHITLNAQRNAVKDAVVLELKDGVQTYVTTIPAPDGGQ